MSHCDAKIQFFKFFIFIILFSSQLITILNFYWTLVYIIQKKDSTTIFDLFLTNLYYWVFPKIILALTKIFIEFDCFVALLCIWQTFNVIWLNIWFLCWFIYFFKQCSFVITSMKQSSRTPDLISSFICWLQIVTNETRKLQEREPLNGSAGIVSINPESGENRSSEQKLCNFCWWFP